ncbi:MAG: hypothetical protein JWM90_1591 [Thermoleophilia bacterium]|nr:hypothetical protein [Thermoleophilia bacterium]
MGLEPLLMKWRADGTLDPDFDGASAANGAVRITATANDDITYSFAQAADGDIVLAGTTGGATPLFRATRFNGSALADYDDDNVATDQNWTEGAGFFGLCLRAFSGTSAVQSWTTHATCPKDETSDYWRPVPLPGTSAKVGQVGLNAVNGSASFRFAAKVPAGTTPGLFVAPITFEVIASAA